MSEIKVDPYIYHEAPADLGNRSEEERETFLFLDRLCIPYERVEHEPAMTIEACEMIDRLLGVSMCKNLFLCNRQKTSFYLLMMPGNKPFRTRICPPRFSPPGFPLRMRHSCGIISISARDPFP